MEALPVDGKTKILENIFFTSYNPEVGQTDSTPCVAGGTGLNVCEMFESGERPIALSQELISWSIYGDESDFHAGDIVYLESTDYPDDPRCNGEFVVADAMNARFNLRGDLFFPERSMNTSCHADVFIYPSNKGNEQEFEEPGTYDLDRLAKAVAIAETDNCTKGEWADYNNCFKSMELDSMGIPHPKKYNSHEESYDEFKTHWTTFYDSFPTYEMAMMWTGSDNADTWLEDVIYYYNAQ